MIRIPTATKSAKGRGIQLSAERLVNMYAEQAPEGAKSPIVVHGCPGLNLFGSVGEKIRGMYRTPADGKLYVVAAQSLFSIASDGTPSNLGTIAGFGRVGMADNGTELCIVTGARGYIYSVSDGLSVIDDRDFPGADTVTFIDGFFVFNNRSNGQKGQFFISDLLDGTTYDALDFATAERYPDNLTRVFADHSELLLFGDESIEVWFNAGNADFPFSRAQGSVIEQGLGARWTVAKVDESVFWLDQEGIVRRLQGQTPLRISTHAIENAISKGDWTNATAYSYTDEGHQFYCLTIPAANLQQTAGTYCFDAATGLWHERQSYEMDHSRVGFYARAFGKHIVGDIDNGNLYEMSLDFYDENGTALIAEMVFPQIQNDGDRFIVSKLQLDMDVAPPSEAFATETVSYIDDWAVVSDNINANVGNLQSAIYGEGIYLFGANDGYINYTVDPNAAWGRVRPPTFTNEVSSIAYGNGTFLACTGGGQIATSPDGINWTARTPAVATVFNTCEYGNGVFVLVGNSDTIQISTDGISWTDKSVTGLSNVHTVTYDGSGRWVAIGRTGFIAYSDDDGATWTVSDSAEVGFSSFAQQNLSAYGNGLWGYVIPNNTAYKSSDGINWETCTSPFDDANALAFGGGLFFSTGDFGMKTSPDMETWTPFTIVDFSGFGLCVYFGNDRWMLGGGNGDAEGAVSFAVSSFTATEADAGDPKIMLDVSGNTRTFDLTQGWRSMGKRGEYDTRVIWRRLGQHRSFTPRLAISSPVKRAVFAAYAEIEPCK